MNRTIKVFHGKLPILIGTLRYSLDGNRESSVFEYDITWLQSPHRFPLELDLPLTRGPLFRKKNKNESAFHRIIADTEPDGWAKKIILRDLSKKRQEQKLENTPIPESLNSLDFLLSVDDDTRIGSLRFQDESEVFQKDRKNKQRGIPPLIEMNQLVASVKAIDENTETASDLAFLLGKATSLGGLRPKCNVLDSDGRLCIGKFPSHQDNRSVTLGEVLALKLAKKSGINAASARIIDSNGTKIALISRFDRSDHGERILYASAATMIGADTSSGNEYTYTEIVDAIRSKGSKNQSDIDELWRRIAFSILITNVDDHLHNHGFLHVSRGLWELSPAFDINPFPHRARELKTWISEESGPAASIEALMSAIKHFNISLEKAKGILNDVEKSVSTWRTEGKKLGMTHSDLDLFSDAFEHEERIITRKLIS